MTQPNPAGIPHDRGDVAMGPDEARGELPGLWFWWM
jgi:hypothetical protein